MEISLFSYNLLDDGIVYRSSSPERFFLELLQLCLQLEMSASSRAVYVLYGVGLVESLHQNLVFCQQTALFFLQSCHLRKGRIRRGK